MIKVNLKGPDGNAFALMGIARNICKQTGDDPDPIISNMMSGDYEHLVEVFKETFEHLVEVED
jgi:hypothetical protein|tara:strand:+ start:533 stop:721 length:189 start_codon:yes stop_codon:yes gene_type:complete